MNRIYILLMILCFVCLGTNTVKCQSRTDSLKIVLESKISEIPQLDHKIELTVSNIPLEEFVRNIANSTKLNINLSTKSNHKVTNNFVNVPAKDVLLFLCKYFDLDLEFTGNIIHITDLEQHIEPYIPKDLKISMDTATQKVNLDLKNDSISLFAKQFTQHTGINVFFAPDLMNHKLSVYVQSLEIPNALDRLAISNNLDLVAKDSSFIFSKKIIEAKNNRNKAKRKQQSVFNYKIYDLEHMDIYGTDVSLHEAIEAVSKKLNLNYFIATSLEGKKDLNLTNVSYTEFLENLLKGTKYTSSLNNNIYLIGDRQSEGIQQTKLITLTYRSVVDLVGYIPENLTKDISIKEFADMNSLIVSGSAPAIYSLESFIKEIDKVVPLVLIELIIIDNNSGYTIETGISAGLAENSTTSAGQTYPNMDYNMGATSMNSLLNSFNGFGIFNLGRVHPRFYMNIKAMEDEGLVKVRSTPKLSTLNGHEAELTIGNTEYYKEEMTNFIVTQSTQQRTNTQYKPVTADFKLKILPVVAGNDEITLQIFVEQSDFTGRIEQNAPPGKVTRQFNSLIRVKNEETIILGGLEEKTINDSSRGVPLLSRIPVIKWLFSKRKKVKNESKLNIFIKPTIIY